MKPAFSLVLALLLAAALPVRAQLYNFQTLDDPAAQPGTTAPQAISGATIVGCFTDANFNSHGFLYNGANFTTLDDPHAASGDNQGTFAQAIDGANIAGFYITATGSSYGFLLKGTAFANFTLRAAPKSTNVFGLSGKNLVGSYYLATTKLTHGFFYNGTTAKTTLIDDPNGNLSLGTYPQGVQGNTVVGFYFAKSGNTSVHGFLYNGTAFTTLDDPNAGPNGTYAQGIYNGTVVGFYFDTNYVTHGFLYDGSGYTDLDVPGANDTLVYGINNGNLVGRYTDTGGIDHGFLATPAPFPAAITTDPANATTFATGIVTFSIKYTGLPIPAIQWQISTDGGTTWSNITGGNYSGLTSATLTAINSPVAASGDQFRAVVTNSGGTAYSTPATLTVNPAITFLALITNYDIAVGDTVYLGAAQAFSVITLTDYSGNLSSLGNLSYQWMLNNKPIAKATALGYGVAKFEAANAGNYTCVIHGTQLAVNITSSPASAALGKAPAFTVSPGSAAVNSGGNLTFTVAATGAPTPTLQWQSSTNGKAWANLTNGSAYSNVTSPTLNIFNATTSLQFRAVATNYFGIANSKAATLTVTPPAGMLDPSLQGNYTLGNVTVAYSGATLPPLTGYTYNVTLTSAGVPAVASAIQSKILQIAGVTVSPKITVTQSTPTTYVGTVTGSLTENLGGSFGSVTLGNISGTENITVVTPGVLTAVFNLSGSINVLGISFPGTTLVITGVFTKSS